MKMKNLTKSLLVAGVALSVGVTAFSGGVAASASTVISETAYEKIVSFTKEDLEKATNEQLDLASINHVYTSLKDTKTWVKLGYNSADAKRIADRFVQSQYQAIGILTDIAHNEGLSLKVITVNKPYFNTVNIGTVGEITNPETGESNTEDSGATEESTLESTEESNQGTLSKAVKEIDIEIEYKNKEIELEYDVKSNGTVKAKYVNEFTGEKTEGAKAQKTIEALFVGLDAKNSSKTEIKNHVISKLNASQKFKKFDFKVKFADKSNNL